MAVAYRSVGTYTTRPSQGTGTISVPAPSGHQAGDIFILYVSLATTGGGTPTQTINAPSGYTLIATSPVWGQGPSVRAITAFYYKIAASSSEPSLTVGTTGTSCFLDSVIAAFSGGDATTPIDAASSYGANDKGTTRSQPAITTVTNNALILYLMARIDGPALTVPAGSTSRFDTTTFAVGLQLATLAAATAGTVAATTWSGAAATNGSIGISVALRLSGAAPASTFVPQTIVIS